MASNFSSALGKIIQTPNGWEAFQGLSGDQGRSVLEIHAVIKTLSKTAATGQQVFTYSRFKADPIQIAGTILISIA
jgi:hypothetical protein